MRNYETKIMNGNHIRKDINRKPLTFTMVIVLLCSMIAIFGLSMDVVSAIPVSESLGTNAQGEEQVEADMSETDSYWQTDIRLIRICM